MIHSANPNDWQFLLGVDFFTDSIGFRRKASGSWQAPQYLWHTGNFSQTIAIAPSSIPFVMY